MNLQWSRIFLSILETGSFAGAARQLHMTQPAISMAMSAMEEHLEQTLLIRSSGQRTGVTPTQAGEIFREYARRSIDLYDEMRSQLLREQTFAPFNIACSPTPGAVLLPILTNAFRRDYPQVPYRLRTYPGNELLRRLRMQEFDIAVTGILFPDADVICEPFFYDPMELICPKSMEVGDTITLRRLQRLPLIIRDQSRNTMRLLINALRSRGFTLSDMNVVMQVSGNSDVLQAVSIGSGVGFVTRSLLNAMPQYCDNVHLVSVKRLSIHRNLHLMRLKNRPVTSGVKLFWEYATADRWRVGNFSYNTKPEPKKVRQSAQGVSTIDSG